MTSARNSLHILICLYEGREPRLIASVFLGEDQYLSHSLPADIEPVGMIDIFYADRADFDVDDLRRAADEAVMPAKELYFRRWLKAPRAVGAVTLVPREKWKGRAQEAVTLALGAVEKLLAAHTT